MRAAAVPLALLLAAAASLGVYAIATALTRGRARRREREARWRVRHYTTGNNMVVAVCRDAPDGTVLDEHVVARIPQDEPDWQARFLAAREEAQQRAYHLNEEPG